MVLRYLLSFVLAIALLAVARFISTRNPQTLQAVSEGVTLTHTTVTEDFGEGPTLEVNSSETEKVRSIVFYKEYAGEPYRSLEMIPESGVFIAKLNPLEKGQRWLYHIEVYKDNIQLAKFPSKSDQFIKFKGRVSPAILIPHIFFMFATIFFGLLAVFTAFDYHRGKGDLKRSAGFLLLTIICAFTGGLPFGIAVTYQASGHGWGGYPFGSDWTDTKTEVLFLFWLVPFIMVSPALRGKPMILSSRVYALLTTVSFTMTIITFLIPHSI
jgi:hypothetical protein